MTRTSACHRRWARCGADGLVLDMTVRPLEATGGQEAVEYNRRVHEPACRATIARNRWHAACRCVPLRHSDWRRGPPNRPWLVRKDALDPSLKTSHETAFEPD